MGSAFCNEHGAEVKDSTPFHVYQQSLGVSETGGKGKESRKEDGKKGEAVTKVDASQVKLISIGFLPLSLLTSPLGIV